VRPAIATATETVFGAYAPLLREHLRRLNQIYRHPNRLLGMDGILAALSLGFHNSSVRSLRTLEDQSRGERFQPCLPLDRVCRSALSDALAQMDANHLLPIVRDLLKRLPALRRQDDDLHALLGTILGDDGSESAAFADEVVGGVIYVRDRNLVDFQFIHAVFNAGSDLLVRTKDNAPNFVVQRENPLNQADRQASVISDRIGFVPGSVGFGQRVLREVTLIDPRSGKPVRLLSSLLDVPARIIGLIYRYRWMIELFFKWLKCVARVRHVFSHSPNGIALEFYVAVIMVLLSYLQTGHRPSLYAFNCLAALANGTMSAAMMQAILAQRERERELERQRSARKKAEKIVP
jgi:hypothetical protein